MNGKEYLAFTKKERNGVFALAVILIAVIFLPKLFQDRDGGPVIAGEELLAKLEKSENNNTTTVADSTEFASGRTSFKNMRDRKSRHFEAGRNNYPYSSLKKKKEISIVDINAADTTEFIALPYIGSKLAARIILFREKLGGFVSTEQVREVYGIQDSVFRILSPFLRCKAEDIRKISVNKADKDLLRGHPYIRWQMANVLINYRTNHGEFRSFDDLLQIENLDTMLLRKAEPYLDFK